jgi:dipeptidyl aminopeptidase/acylaminoacyl peptidase
MFRAMSRSRCALWLPLLLVIGCGQPVREDRSMNYEKDGDAVAFQHGNNGVFVADKDGAPKKIFQPPADVLATSSPLWSPTDKRLIFTTAKRAKDDPAGKELRLGGDGDPAGKLHFEAATVYTCWLREEEKDGKAPEPVALFRAACDHPGYVAANLAVRWHPDGKRILFVEQTDQDHHGAFEFDLETKKSRPAFPHAAEAVVFDWAPDKVNLVCALGSKKGPSATDGVWIGKPGSDDWWQVPESAVVSPGERAAVLEHLRATRPAWSRDGKRFAFTGSRAEGPMNQPVYYLYLGTLATRKVEKLAEDEQPLRDVRWSPDGERLGYVAGAEEGSLYLLRLAGGKPARLAANVRGFAGWDANNEHLAYVAADPIPHRDGTAWALLFGVNPRARDALCLAPADGSDAGKKAFSGMQVTFPQWSPKDGKLSLWATFNPPFRSGASLLLELLGVFAKIDEINGQPAPMDLDRLRVRPGDPALLLDPATGALDWKAVNAREEYQLGHYALLKRDYAAAWEWYEKANKHAAAEDERESLFFQFYCLTKLKRADEAKAKLAQFERDFLPKPPPAKDAKPDVPTAEDWIRALTDPKSPHGRLLQDLYVAEVFLSLDDAEGGEAYFRDVLKSAEDDATRLSRAVVLSQLLLLRQKHAEYADLADATLLPLLLAQDALRTARPGAKDPLDDITIIIGRHLAVLPLCDTTYVKQLDESQARRHLARLRELRQAADTDAKRLWLDLLIEAACRRLGDAEGADEAAQRVRDNPERLDAERGNDAAALIGDLRRTAARMEEGRQFWQLLH